MSFFFIAGLGKKNPLKCMSRGTCISTELKSNFQEPIFGHNYVPNRKEARNIFEFFPQLINPQNASRDGACGWAITSAQP